MKKLIMLSLFTYTLSFTSAFSQGTWSSRSSLPDSGRDGGVGFSIGNYGYMGLGSDVGSFPHSNYLDFWRFNPSNDSWARMANFPDSETWFPAFFVIGNYGYVVTGQGDHFEGCTNRCWQYNAITNKWTEKASFPGAVRVGAVGFSIGGKGYVGMGTAASYETYYKDFWCYDTTTNVWRQIADFGSISRLGSSGFSVVGKGYVCFGRDSTFTFHNDMWAYDTGSNTWTQKSDCPGIVRTSANGFVIGSYIFVGTGVDSTATCDSDFYQYNTVTDTWKTITSFPGMVKDRRVGSSAFSISDTGYFGLGTFLGYGVNPAYYFNDLYRFIPDSITGIANFSAQPELFIYPNPANKFLTIKFSQQLHGLATLFIMDITGRELLNSQLTIHNSQLTIDVSSLSSGMYFLNIQNRDTYVIQKFIKY